MLRQTIVELGHEVPPEATLDQLIEASKRVSAERKTVGFKRTPEVGLILEARNIKAMIKEVINILYAGGKWGKHGKGPKNYVAERCFVEPMFLPLDREAPDGVDLVIGHPNGPRGPQSTLTYHEYVQYAELAFDFLVTKEARKDLNEERWAEFWTHAQLNGIGALRSQGHGTFTLLAWDLVEPNADTKSKKKRAA